MEVEDASIRRDKLRYLIRVLVFSGGVLFAAIFLFAVSTNVKFNSRWWHLAEAHFPAVIGLPLAAFGALFVVLFLEAKSGRIEFEALGMKFRGASGEVVLFVLVFVSFAGAIKALW